MENYLEFPAKWGNRVMRKFRLFREFYFRISFVEKKTKFFSFFAKIRVNSFSEIIFFWIDRYLQKFRKNSENFREKREFSHRLSFLLQISFSRKNVKFSGKVCEIRKKIFAKFRIFSRKFSFAGNPTLIAEFSARFENKVLLNRYECWTYVY